MSSPPRQRLRFHPLARFQIVEVTLLRHPPFRKAVRGLSSGPGFRDGRWRRLTTRCWYITLSTTPISTEEATPCP